MKGLDAARALYLEKGAELIHTRFPEFEMRIAVGLAGAGSQCLGFDDDVSHDHDFEPGFCLWLTDADDDAIGLALSREMRGLFGGKVSKSSALGTSGVGVMRISDFGALPAAPALPKRGATGCICPHTLLRRQSAARCSVTISVSSRAYAMR